MILEARRSPKLHNPSRSQKPGIVLGLRYERRLLATLKEQIKNKPFTLEHNPWFFYRASDEHGRILSKACAPDFLLHDDEFGLTHVIECKYTWIPDAISKLREVYCPIVQKALGRATLPLVVVKKLTPDAPMPRLGLLTPDGPPLFQWSENTPLIF